MARPVSKQRRANGAERREVETGCGSGAPFERDSGSAQKIALQTKVKHKIRGNFAGRGAVQSDEQARPFSALIGGRVVRRVEIRHDAHPN